MGVWKPEHWYMLFWVAMGAAVLTPIYVLLYLILQAVKKG